MFLMASGYAGAFVTTCIILTLGDELLHEGFSLTLVWVSNAVPRPPTKRAAAIGIVNGFGNLGNLYVMDTMDHTRLIDLLYSIGSYAWKAEWGPAYHQSMIIAIAALAFASFLTTGELRSFVVSLYH